MKPHLLTVLAVILCISVYGQSDYRKGFVITLSHDTTSGLVNFRDGGKAFEVCDFKTSPSANATTYTPKDIAGYGFVGDKRFESKNIKIEGGVEVAHFLEVVVHGKVTLYQMRDKYWVQKENADLLPLENNEKEQYVDGQRVIRYDNKHIATLSMVMADCPDVTISMRNLRLDKRPLTKIVNDYNQCIGGSSVVVQEKKPWAEFHIGVAAGANFSALEFTGTESIAGAITGTTKNTAPMIGVMVDIVSPRVNERIAVVTGAYYLPMTYVTESKFNPGSDYLKIKLDQLKVPVGVKYLFKGRRIVPFVNAGMSFTFNVKSNVTWYEPARSPNIAFLQSDFMVKTTELGYWGGLGATVPITSKLGALVELRYEHTNGITPHMQSAYLQSSINNLQVLVAVRF